MTKFFPYLLLAGLVLVGASSCVNLEFDEPPVANLPNLQANITIAEFKALHQVGTPYKQITDSLFIEGVVIADDESGNWFRQIAIQDETAGIVLRLNSVGLFGQYPVGRKVFVSCRGLWLGDFNGLHQINGAPDTAIAERLIAQHVFAGPRDQPVTARTATIADFGPELVGSLIRLEGVQFAITDTSRTYADAVNRRTENRTLEDCEGRSTIVRTSGFADFAPNNLPNGGGSLTAVLTVFGTTYQLILRDERDVQLNGARCEISTGGELMSIAELRSAFASGANQGPADRKIRGVVISDRANGNLIGNNLIIQDASGGIMVRFTANHIFSLGEEVEVNVDGKELSEFNGLLQLNNVELSAAVSTGPGIVPAPRVATVAEVIANLEAWESTLVKIEGATISGGNNYSANNIQVSDGSGTIVLFTRNTATFANTALPTGEVSLTAIISQFNTPQLLLRNLGDVTGGGGPVEPTLMDIADLRALFSGSTTSAPANRKIRGVVISDKDNGNTQSRNLVMQDGSAGIVVRFNANHNFALGEEIEVNVSGEELSTFRGLLQVTNVPNANALSFGPGTLPTPRETTIQGILDNMQAWESTLVKVADATFTGGGTYAGSKTVQDGTGSIEHFTRNDASFAGQNVPNGPVSLTAVVSVFDDPQLIMRNLTDIGQ
jgi:hypothetical protein